jgi:hypothetical protein
LVGAEHSAFITAFGAYAYKIEGAYKKRSAPIFIGAGAI